MSTSPSRPTTAPRVYHLPLVDEQRETPDVVTFRFARDAEKLQYQAGQYVALKLQDVQDPRGNVRPFTLSSSPTEEDFISITSKMTGSPFKERLLSFEEGEEAEVRGPMGWFTLDPNRPAVMIAGGIGITPFRSMLRDAADRGLNPTIVLLYSNSTPEEITFREELEELAEKLRKLKVVHTISHPERSKSPWHGRTGRINAAMIRLETEGLEGALHYVCGPPSMVEDISKLLKEGLSLEQGDIRVEKFTGY